ncbi:unnamed protein product [Adineta steineri]|uniref:C3H1-type domain-containing protein n=1 Tax=Adineta steineri TaxID=433720 RepID=A0A814WIT8_9BILA|nr:unnamed protein product [Adineta steineri]CAF3530189.1 unnamed protein product [Adineta steineri]
MHKSNEDCFYFLTSSCTKGSSCTYRHSPLAVACNVICPSWSRGNCPDPACPYRHSRAQRPMVNNGILCFYENTPTGCLKLDCTFIHSRPRMNLLNPSTIRPVTTNFVRKDVTKSLITNIPSTDIPEAKLITNSSQSTINEPQSIIPNTPLESTSVMTSPSTVKNETIIRRVAIPPAGESSNEIKDSSDNNHSVIKSTTRSVITDSTKEAQEEITTSQSRLIVNRNVVLTEPSNISTRKVVQTKPSPSSSSNRVVVSADTVKSPSKGKKNDADCSEQENKTKRFKQDSQSMINISFPCSTPTIISRVSLIPAKESTSTNDKKPVRLNRDRLPATNGISSTSTSKQSNEEKLSAGTELSQEQERRTMRLERFQKKTISPPRSTISSSSSSSSLTNTNDKSSNSSNTRNVITAPSNERKRTASETTMKDTPPTKRTTVSSAQAQSSPRQTNSSPTVLTHSRSSSVRDKNRDKQTDDRITKNVQQKNSSPQSESVVSSTTRPRFIPQPILPPSSHQSRQTPSVAIKRPPAPVTATTSQKSSEPIQQISQNHVVPSNSTVENKISNTINEEDEKQLLITTDPSDVVDTFALIDEALLEADHLLELM